MIYVSNLSHSCSLSASFVLRLAQRYAASHAGFFFRQHCCALQSSFPLFKLRAPMLPSLHDAAMQMSGSRLLHTPPGLSIDRHWLLQSLTCGFFHACPWTVSIMPSSPCSFFGRTAQDVHVPIGNDQGHYGQGDQMRGNSLMVVPWILFSSRPHPVPYCHICFQLLISAFESAFT